MTLALRPARLALVAILHLGLLAAAPARADEPSAELRAPSPPSPEAEAALAQELAKLPEELRASFPGVVDDARSRLRVAADGSGVEIGIDEAARAAVLAADFGGASKRKSRLEAMVRLTVLQMTLDLHAAVREELGHRLAVRAVKACKGKPACLDEIAPSATMLERHVTSVRVQFGSDTAALTAAELASAKELERLGVMYAEAGRRFKAFLEALIDLQKEEEEKKKEPKKKA
jgi:hypothetical protein